MEPIRKVTDQEIEETSCLLMRASGQLTRQTISESTNYRKRKTTHNNEDYEADGILSSDSDISVGTSIKREAKKLYERYHSLSCESQSIVALGLNSIIDLTYYSAPQKKIFNEKDWSSLRDVFPKRLNEAIVFNSKIGGKVFKIEQLVKDEVSEGRLKSLKYESKAKTSRESDIYSIYSQYLELLEFHSYVFGKDIDVTENDITVKIWSPIVERLFRRTPLRTKWGESIGDSHDVTSNIGFKVDLRILKDTVSRRRREADKANVEVAKMNPSFIKITNDRTKLFIESKAVLDKLVKEVPKCATDIIIPGLQITGNKITLYSLKLEANGLYVGVNEGVAIAPNNITRIKELREVISLLYKFKDATMNVANLDLLGDDESKNNNNNNNESASWVRGTWIPPNSDKRTRLPAVPDNLFFSDLN